MEKIVKIPEGIKLEQEAFKTSVEGKLGKLERDFYSPLFAKKITIEKSGSEVKVKTDVDKRKIKSMVGTIASHINNMIKGVTEGWEYNLKIVYLHFPMTVKVEGNMLTVSNFLGSRSMRKAKILENVKVEIKADEVKVTGIDKEAVGQTALNIERAAKVKTKDRRVFQDGIHMTSKAGKGV
ncbi:MAG: 50S ribosomal protein L6 [Candidatus Aenigmarchaeota archaeon]|nr:50S ribosomal protein L6 [Candidatus Aenigmarchaeota archaeon]